MEILCVGMLEADPSPAAASSASSPKQSCFDTVLQEQCAQNETEPSESSPEPTEAPEELAPVEDDETVEEPERETETSEDAEQTTSLPVEVKDEVACALAQAPSLPQESLGTEAEAAGDLAARQEESIQSGPALIPHVQSVPEENAEQAITSGSHVPETAPTGKAMPNSGSAPLPEEHTQTSLDTNNGMELAGQAALESESTDVLDSEATAWLNERTTDRNLVGSNLESLDGAAVKTISAPPDLESAETEPQHETAESTTAAARVSPEIRVADSGTQLAEESAPVQRTTAEALLDDTVRGIRYLVRQGEKTVSIRLVPESLGDLTLEVSSSQEAVHVRLIASDTSVRNILDGEIAQLRASLAEEGIEVGRVQVVSSMTLDLGSGQSSERPGPGFTMEASSSGTAGTAAASPLTQSETKQETLYAAPHTGTLNVFV